MNEDNTWYARAQADFNNSVLHHSKTYLIADYLRLQLKTFVNWHHAKHLVFGVFVLFLLFLEFSHNTTALFFAIAAVLCFVPMTHHDYLGLELSFSAMIIISSLHGFPLGIAIGKIPNFIGHFITHRIDFNLVYELLVFAPIAYLASLIPVVYLVELGIVLSLLYNIGYLLFYSFIGLLLPKHMMYALSHFLLNVIVLVNVVPLLA